ncbi:CD166 antigen homolog [Lates japonicus]|uniref:CD166 antigen homolog n=1 Tax=Lates japonicus TaxID=270547 RepID=A0AAD3NGP5_LATJO|nr:CD166 antigen homolog [Lates japonicus]
MSDGTPGDLLIQTGHVTSHHSDPQTIMLDEKPSSVQIMDKSKYCRGQITTLDPATDLPPLTQYAATKDDVSAVFACIATHVVDKSRDRPGTFPIHYPSETVNLEIKTPIAEGDNVTLKCQADGNPPPSSFFFHIKGQKMLVKNSDTYTLTAINREDTGEYKCSLSDNEKLEASQSILVNCEYS